MKNSIRYAYPTISEVTRMIFAMLSKCRIVMKSFNPNSSRAGIASVITIANPEKIAPATKYGGKIVVCQPGTCDTAKSNDTTLCTDNTNGVANPAKIKYAFSY